MQQQGVDSEPGVPSQAEAMEGTGDLQPEVDSKPGVLEQAEAMEGTGDQKAMQPKVDSKPGVREQAEAMEGTGDQEAMQPKVDLKPGVPEQAEAMEGTGDQEAQQQGAQLAIVQAGKEGTKTQQRTDAVFKALEQPNKFDLKEATLTRKEGESQEDWMARVAHNVFMKFHRASMAHGLEIAVPAGSDTSSSGITRRPSSMALPVALGDQEAGSALTSIQDPMDKKKKTALLNQAKNKIALASTKLDEATVLQEEISASENMSQPIRDGFLKDLQNHGQSLGQARDKLSAELDKGSGQLLQELLDDLNQKITNYVQSTNGMKKLSATRLAALCRRAYLGVRLVLETKTFKLN
ncbi:unnamed protein product [Symbiodinium necroappetens]|uniref:Uncharacterized protein n=1 Tax=Symbiodinium necroappetens TaxID=1628268 RepID=A0A812WDQ8_9DINO|nr:unnamed protein product [Symbiodinium necroappetens]